MYYKNTLFTKAQATEVINLMLDSARSESNKTDMSRREIYEAMQNNRMTVHDWDDPDTDIYEIYCNNHDIPCISFSDIQKKFAEWVTRVSGEQNL